ncbi:hypothetical protein NW807_04955 [Synechococcus sp. R70.1]|jgi:hypothetical protein|uniref:hypothetical protein n=1 Tax=Synechococcus sp. R70.1 TaxID=2964531 RepID=UPI0039C1706F
MIICSVNTPQVARGAFRMLYRFPKSLRWLRLGGSHRSKQERQIVRSLLAFAGALLAVDILLLGALH